MIGKLLGQDASILAKTDLYTICPYSCERYSC
jgi:hypothetical protein